MAGWSLYNNGKRFMRDSRGSGLTGSLSRSITWGILLQYFVQFGCSYIEGVASFRIPWGLQMIPAIFLSLGMLIFPEVRALCFSGAVLHPKTFLESSLAYGPRPVRHGE